MSVPNDSGILHLWSRKGRAAEFLGFAWALIYISLRKKNIGVTGLSYFFVNVGNSVQFVVNVGFHMILQIRLPLRRGHGC